MTEITLKVEPGAEAPRESRSHLSELRAELEPRFGDVALVLSELVTNSVRHGGGEHLISVGVETSTESIRVEVTDYGPCFSKDGPRNGGMGLDIVDRIADRWGVIGDGGCTVWVEMSKRVELSPDQPQSGSDESSS